MIRQLPRRGTQFVLSFLWLGQIRRGGVRIGGEVRLHGKPVVTRAARSELHIGERVSLISRASDTALGVSHPVVLRTLREGASLEIGADSGLSGVSICAAHSVTIGNRVLLGADVLIFDTDFHPVGTLPRRYASLPPSDPRDAITIEDDVFVGARAVILPGSHIGAGSVIGAGSIVSGEIPANVVAAGNPCRVLRRLSKASS